MKTTLTLVCILCLIACTNKRDELNNKIISLEKEIFNSTAALPDPVKAGEIIQLYTDFAARFPGDSTSAEYLFKAAEVSSSIGESGKAIELLDKLIKEYPRSSKNEVALFFKGFIYETQLSDYFNAGKTYDQFIQSYPQSELIDDARAARENLGKSPEELIRQFEENIENDTVMFPS